MHVTCSACGKINQLTAPPAVTAVRCQQCAATLALPVGGAIEEQLAGGKTQLFQIPKQFLAAAESSKPEDHNSETQVQKSQIGLQPDMFTDHATQMLRIPAELLQKQRSDNSVVTANKQLEQMSQSLGSAISQESSEDFQDRGTQAMSPSTKVLRQERRQSRWSGVWHNTLLCCALILLAILAYTMPMLYQGYVAGWLEGKIELQVSNEPLNGVQLDKVAAFVVASPNYEPMLLLHGTAKIADGSRGFLPDIHLTLQNGTGDGGKIIQQPFGVWIANDVLPMLQDKHMYERWLTNGQRSAIPTGSSSAAFALQLPLPAEPSLAAITMRLVPMKEEPSHQMPSLQTPLKISKTPEPSPKSTSKPRSPSKSSSKRKTK